MLIITEETLRTRFNEAMEDLQDSTPLIDEDKIQAHATRTVVEAIEVEVYKMLDRMHWQRQELINKAFYG